MRKCLSCEMIVFRFRLTQRVSDRASLCTGKMNMWSLTIILNVSAPCWYLFCIYDFYLSFFCFPLHPSINGYTKLIHLTYENKHVVVVALFTLTVAYTCVFSVFPVAYHLLHPSIFKLEPINLHFYIELKKAESMFNVIAKAMYDEQNVDTVELLTVWHYTLRKLCWTPWNFTIK